LTTPANNTIVDVETGWKDIQTAGSPGAGEGAFYRSFASGMLDFSRPVTPSKHFLYATWYARLKGVPNGTLGSGVIGTGRITMEARYRWVGYPT